MTCQIAIILFTSFSSMQIIDLYILGDNEICRHIIPSKCISACLQYTLSADSGKSTDTMT